MITQRAQRIGIRIVVPKRHVLAVMIVAAIAAIMSVTVATMGLSLALFTAQPEGEALFGTKALFPGERVTPAFEVEDSSSGTGVDRSSSLAFSADGLVLTTSSWSTSFAVDRYVEFDLNDSLASGVAVSAATFDFRFASSGAGQACYFFEVRRISSGAVLGTHGSSGSPVGCVTGMTPSSFSTSIASLATTSIANDLRVRLFGRESGGAAMVIDVSTVTGSSPHQTFTLYPVMVRDAADTTPEIIPWELLVP